MTKHTHVVVRASLSCWAYKLREQLIFVCIPSSWLTAGHMVDVWQIFNEWSDGCWIICPSIKMGSVGPQSNLKCPLGICVVT